MPGFSLNPSFQMIFSFLLFTSVGHVLVEYSERIMMSGMADSNCRPLGPKPSTLPTEPIPAYKIMRNTFFIILQKSENISNLAIFDYEQSPTIPLNLTEVVQFF